MAGIFKVALRCNSVHAAVATCHKGQHEYPLALLLSWASAPAVIATDWSGPTAFLDEGVVYPLAIDGLGWVEDKGVEGYKWAAPSVQHLYAADGSCSSPSQTSSGAGQVCVAPLMVIAPWQGSCHIVRRSHNIDGKDQEDDISIAVTLLKLLCQ